MLQFRGHAVHFGSSLLPECCQLTVDVHCPMCVLDFTDVYTLIRGKVGELPVVKSVQPGSHGNCVGNYGVR